jgi:hypothetical protein
MVRELSLLSAPAPDTYIRVIPGLSRASAESTLRFIPLASLQIGAKRNSLYFGLNGNEGNEGFSMVDTPLVTAQFITSLRRNSAKIDWTFEQSLRANAFRDECQSPISKRKRTLPQQWNNRTL